MRILLPLALLAASLASGAEPASSTAPARGARELVQNPWSLNYGLDRRGRTYGLDYRIRWDAGDLRGSTRAARRNFSRPSETAESIAYGLLIGARLNLYGVRVRPFRNMAPPAPAVEETDAAAASAAEASAAPPPRRLRLALDPFGDLRRNGPREVERFLLREGFDLAMPRERGVPSWQKEAVSRSVLAAGRSWSGEEP